MKSPYGITVVRRVTPTERRRDRADACKALAEFRAMSADERQRTLDALRRMAR